MRSCREDDNGPVKVNTDLVRMAGGVRRRAAELSHPSRSLPALTLRMWYFDTALALALAAITVRSVERRQQGGTMVFPQPAGGVVMIPDPSSGVPVSLIVTG